MPDRAVLTIATGKPLYFEMALTLARSFRRWNSDNAIAFYLVTDQASPLPTDLRGQVHVRCVEPNQFGDGFSPKLHLDELACANATLFIDADCLCGRGLSDVFERFAGRSVATVGGRIAEGEWFGDVRATCRRLGVSSLPKFNGGVYYLERGPMSREVYATARRLEAKYDDLGLVRLRGRPNDELVMAGAMAIHGLESFPDDGSILGDPQACPGPITLHIVTGKVRMINPPPPHPDHRDWYLLSEISPAIIHFLGEWNRHPVYRREACVLRLIGWNCPAALACMLGRFIVAPLNATEILRTWLRPLYRAVFGVRRLRRSDRLPSVS